jgi:hypothetical protein
VHEPGASGLPISAAVEGLLDEVVIRRLVHEAGGSLGPFHGMRGKQFLRARIAGYNRAAMRAPWVVLIDLDDESDCAVPLREQWLPLAAPGMRLRVAVRAIEAWLLADREAIAAFLGVPISRVQSPTEAYDDPKRAVVDLARRSARREIRAGIVPRHGSGREVGPEYVSRMSEFAFGPWRPDVAETQADSLRRCRARVAELVRAYPARVDSDASSGNGNR